MCSLYAHVRAAGKTRCTWGGADEAESRYGTPEKRKLYDDWAQYIWNRLMSMEKIVTVDNLADNRENSVVDKKFDAFDEGNKCN